MKTVKARDDWPDERDDEAVATVASAPRYVLGRIEGRSRNEATSVMYLPEQRMIFLHLAAGKIVQFSADDLPELMDLPDVELERMKVTFNGTALSIDAKDIDISVAGIIRAFGDPSGSGSSGETHIGRGHRRAR